MRHSSTRTFTSSLACSAIAALFLATQSLANRFEELGPPENIDLADGSALFIEGVGLDNVPSGQININVPFEATVEQVLLYWAGRATSSTDPGDSDTITVNAESVTGIRIGSSSSVLPSHAYRADITDKGWVSSGAANVLTVSGLDFAYQNDGAAVVVIADDGSMNAIQIVDGNDFAYLVRSNQTEAVDFPVEAAEEDRFGVLKLIVTDIAIPRPAAVDITVNGVTTRYDNILQDNEGDFLDIVELNVLVPAGVSNVTAQLLSIEDGISTPASLAWLFGSFEIAEEDDPEGCTYTIGYWKNHPYDWPTDELSLWLKDPALLLLWTPTKGGNAYIILAHQYIAAELNVVNGASIPEDVLNAWLDAQDLLFAYQGEGNIPKKTADRDEAIDLAEILDMYNNGELGPGHCDDTCDEEE